MSGPGSTVIFLPVTRPPELDDASSRNYEKILPLELAAGNAPPTFRLILAGAPVEAECSRVSRYRSKRASGVVLKRALCWITGVMTSPEVF
jgi:hypothetical protein